MLLLDLSLLIRPLRSILVFSLYASLHTVPRDSCNMGGTPLTLTKALDIAKENQNGQVPPAVSQMLERKIADIWRKIQAQPNTYVMSREEFAVFSYYRSRYDNNRTAQDAVARFWSNYKGESTVDGTSSSSKTPSTHTSGNR